MPVLPDDDAWDRISKAVRWIEAARVGCSNIDYPFPPLPDIGVATIRVTGPAVLMAPPQGAITTPVTIGLQLDDGSNLNLDGSSSFLGLDDEGSPSVDTTNPRYVYMAVLTWRNIDRVGEVDEWNDLDRVWAAELNDGDLKIGKRYLGIVVGTYGSLGLVEVNVGGSSDAIVHVTGKPCVLDGRRWYPGKLADETDPMSYAIVDGALVWLLQALDGELATDGGGYYNAVARSYSYTIAGETRRVYETAELRRLLNGACDPITGQWKGVFEGSYQGDQDPSLCTTSTTSTTTTTTTTP